MSAEFVLAGLVSAIRCNALNCVPALGFRATSFGSETEPCGERFCGWIFLSIENSQSSDDECSGTRISCQILSGPTPMRAAASAPLSPFEKTVVRQSGHTTKITGRPTAITSISSGNPIRQ